jgi:5'-nucleotidase/UDP-sugar diphosphatase
VIKAVIRALAIVFLAAGSLWPAAETHVIVMHTNDIHGRILPGAEAGGSARLAAIVRQLKPDLMLDAGGVLSGSLISDMFQGEPVVKAMNAIGYDAVAVGSSEFGFGVPALRARSKQANFLFLSANATSPIDEVQPAAIYNAQGIRIAVIGLTSQEITGHPQNVKYVDVADAVRTLEDLLPRIRDRVDSIILLSNVGPAEEQRIARTFPEIRVIIGAHEEAELPVRVGQTTIVGAGKFGKYVGKLDLTFIGGRLKGVESRLIPLSGVEPEPAVERLLEPYETELDQFLQTVLGQAAGDLSRSTAEESHLGNLVADAVRAKTGTEIALIDAADARTGIPKGPITSRTLFEVLPSENTLVTMRLNGAQIKRILGRTMLSVSGVRVKLDSGKPEGKRLVSVRLANGTPIHDKDLYTVTTNDYLSMGGGGFTEFADGMDVEDTGILLRDAVAEHIARLGTVSPHLDGRIQFSK